MIWKESRYTVTMRFYRGVVPKIHGTQLQASKEHTHQARLFARPQFKYYRHPCCSISEILNVSKFQTQKATQNKASLMKKKLDFKLELESKVKHLEGR